MTSTRSTPERRGPGGETSVPRVFFTGVGVLSSIGIGKKAFFTSLEKGTSGIRPVTGFDTASLGRSLAGEVRGFEPRDHLTASEMRRMARCSMMAVAAARMAVEDAGLAPADLEGPRTSVVLGTTMGEAELLGELEHRWIVDGPDAVHRRSVARQEIKRVSPLKAPAESPLAAPIDATPGNA